MKSQESSQFYVTRLHLFHKASGGGTRNFFVGGIEGAKSDSEGAKIKKFAKNGWFWPFFSFWLGGIASDGGGGGKCPHAPQLDAATESKQESKWFSESTRLQLSLSFLYFSIISSLVI